ncbi:MAG TPA: hypothetical protein VFZ61_26445 [Polyangiales bacterium]
MIASRIERIEPERVMLTSRRAARIRVVGTCRGWLRCGRERRWVWGRFDHTFLVRGPAAKLGISVVGLGGWQRRTLTLRARFDLAPPRPRRRGSLRVLAPVGCAAPRVRHLTREDLARAAEHAR